MGYNYMVGNPASNTTHKGENSPVPFLVGGVVVIVVVVAISLFILVFSLMTQMESRKDTEANVMVIMAVDERITFLGRPAILCRAVNW